MKLLNLNWSEENEEAFERAKLALEALMNRLLTLEEEASLWEEMFVLTDPLPAKEAK